MRFKIDEHLPLEIKDLLAQHRHDPVTVPDEGMAVALILTWLRSAGRKLVPSLRGFVY